MSAALDDLRAVLTRYVALPSREAADAVVLWIAATYGIEAWAHATRLVIKSPEMRCGKSRLLDIVEGTCRQPFLYVNASTAALFRSIGDDPPTLLVDEVDALFGTRQAAESNEDMRALLNSGFQRGRPVIRCVGPNQTPVPFPTFAMAALAGIGSLPSTVEDRAVVISIRRRLDHEVVQPFRERRDRPVLNAARDTVSTWVSSVMDELYVAEPTMPLEDRAADCWESLVAVADAAGGTWPDRARNAAVVLVAEHDAETVEQSTGVKLLADIRDLAFVDTTSADLVAALRDLPESPWSSFELTPNSLARRLQRYGIRPDRISTGDDRRRGYRRSQFADAFARYAPTQPSQPSNRPNVPLTWAYARTHADAGTVATVHPSTTVRASPQVRALPDRWTDEDGHPRQAGHDDVTACDAGANA